MIDQFLSRPVLPVRRSAAARVQSLLVPLMMQAQWEAELEEALAQQNPAAAEAAPPVKKRLMNECSGTLCFPAARVCRAPMS